MYVKYVCISEVRSLNVQRSLTSQLRQAVSMAIHEDFI